MLASASPRRRELLARAGLRFAVVAADLDERPRPGEGAGALCLRLAREKAAAVAASFSAGVILAGDTLVVRDGVALGKPSSREDARRMLVSLSARTHEVLSAVALHALPGPRVLAGLATARVAFGPLGGDALQAYLDSGEWEGKAGAYAIQGLAGAFARLVEGSLDTVVGLPVDLVADLALGLLAPAQDSPRAPAARRSAPPPGAS